MTKTELRNLIKECIQENNVEEGFFDTVKHFGKNVAGAVKDQWGKAKQAGDWEAGQRASLKQGIEKGKAGQKFIQLKNDFQNKLTNSLKSALQLGDKTGIDRKEVIKTFRSALVATLNRYSKVTQEEGIYDKGDYANFSKAHDQRVDAYKGIDKMKSQLEKEFDKTLRDAIIQGEKSQYGIGRKDAIKLFRSAAVGILNGAHKLEEKLS